MAITIDWENKIINVPKSDLTLIQSSPTEIRELDINWFRLKLRELEASVEGMPYERTHEHFTEVTLGGLTFARVVQIINNYTVTFEDGQYAVELVNANSNIGDVVNVNQVSVRSNNSAGLISTPLIEYAAFEGVVSIDPNSSLTGTTFPAGTKRHPVNNLEDALLIAAFRGLQALYIEDDFTLNAGSNINDFHIYGHSRNKVNLTLPTDLQSSGLTIEEVSLDGVIDGGFAIRDCEIHDIEVQDANIHECGLYGTITLSGNKDVYIEDCFQADRESPPVIDMGGAGQNLLITKYTGRVKLTNFSDPSGTILVTGNGLEVIIDSTSVTDGNIYLSGTGVALDENFSPIDSGATYVNNAFVQNQLLSLDSISTRVWNTATLVEDIAKLTGNKVTKSGDIITIYEDDETTVWRQYDLSGGGRLEI